MKRTTLISLGIFALLFAYYFLFEIKKEPKSEWFEEKLFLVEEEEIKKIVLTYQKKEYTLKKEEKEWILTAPIKDKADEEAIKKIVESLAGMVAYKKIKKKEIEDFSLFGFPEVNLKVEFWAKGVRNVLRVGKKNPSGRCFYVQRNQEENIYLVGKSEIKPFKKHLYGLRNKVIFPSFKKEEVTKIKIVYPEFTVECTRDPGERWHLTTPFHARADKYVIEDILEKVKKLEALDFISEQTENLKRFKLDSPAIKITLQIGKDRSEEIIFGEVKEERREEERKVFVKVSGRKTIFEVDEWTVEDLTHELKSFQDMSVFEFKKEDIIKVHLIYPNQKFLCQKKKDSWYLKEPIEALAAKYTVEGIIGDLDYLKAKKFIKEPAELSQYGFNHPPVKVILEQKDKKFTLVVGDNLTGEEEEKLAYGLYEEEKKVFTMPRWRVDNLSGKKLVDLRERNIFKFSHQKAISFKIKFMKEVVNCVRVGKEKKDWQIIEPKRKKIKKEKITSLFNKLNQLRVKKFIREKIKPLPEYGLDTPKVVVSLNLEETTEQKTILIGKQTTDKENYYAKLKKETEIVLLPARQVKELKKKMVEIFNVLKGISQK